MAVYTYGATNMNFSTFYIWSNGVSGNSNVSMNNALSDAVPANINPTSASEIYSNSWFYGQLQVSTGGFVDISGAYTQGNVSTTTTLKNVNLDLANLVLTADEAAAYPRTFVRWRAGSSGGAQIQTGVTLTLSSAVQTSTTVFYAEFT